MCSSFALVVLAACLAPQAGPQPRAPAARQRPVGEFPTVAEALELAFPECAIERGRVFLDPEQKRAVAELSGTACEGSLVFPYVATRDGELGGTAYFDTHRVRTLRETLMIVVDPQGRVRRVEMLAFGEPREYVPRGSWYAQLIGRALDDELSLKGRIRGVSGATLTARATVDAVRRTLAVHAVLGRTPEPDTPEKPEKPPEPEPSPAPDGAGSER